MKHGAQVDFVRRLQGPDTLVEQGEFAVHTGQIHLAAWLYPFDRLKQLFDAAVEFFEAWTVVGCFADVEKARVLLRDVAELAPYPPTTEQKAAHGGEQQ